MKTLLLGITLCLSLISFAQVPDFLGNNPEWYSEQPDDTQYPCWPRHKYTVYLDGEETIGNYTYKKAYRHGITEYTLFANPNLYPPGYCSGVDTIFNFEGYIRQDSLKFYTYADGRDSLLYDFDLELGDTTEQTYVMLSEGWVVTSIDSVLINGWYAKKFYLKNNQMSAADSSFIIQGVGCEGGLFFRFPGYFESDPNLICYAQDGTTYFSTGQCNYSVSLDELSDVRNTRIYPNPVSDFITIEGLNTETMVELVSMDGRRVLESSTSGSVDVRNLGEGMYLLRIFGGNNEETFRVRIQK